MSFKVGALLACCAVLVTSVQGDIAGRILGGKDAEFAQFPYQISLRRLGSHVCGGSIISNSFILTAAHCVVDKDNQADPAEWYSIRAGSNNRIIGGVVRRVESIVIYEKYDGFVGDIALLKLDLPLVFSYKIQPIELATEKVPSGSEVIISGWGLLENGSEIVPTKMQYNTVKAISSFKCDVFGIIRNQILCLSHKTNNGACNGDSGGPATYKGKLVGVANFVMRRCGSSKPDGYASVAFYTEWIKSQIA